MQNNRIANKLITILGDTFSGYSTFRNTTFIEQNQNTDLKIQYQDEFDQATRAKALGKTADIIVTTLDQDLLHQPNAEIVVLSEITTVTVANTLNSQRIPHLKSSVELPKLSAQTRKIVHPAITLSL